MAYARSVCCHRYVRGRSEESKVSVAEKEELLYRVGFKSANLLKMSLVTATAMLVTCLLALSWDRPAGATLPGENGRIAFSDLQNLPGDDFEIYTMLPDGTDVRQVTDKSGRDQVPTWSPDGTKLGWVRKGQFWVHDVNTGQQRMVASIEGAISAVVWSPDGSKLAYAKQTPLYDGLGDIFVMNADGTNRTNLTNTKSVDEWDVNWPPDGSKLAYTRHTWPTTGENQPEIHVMNADGTNRVNLTDSIPEDMSVVHPNWSPDGTKIAFLGGSGVYARVYTMNADGTNPVSLTSGTTEELGGPPIWSPDGTKISFLTCTGRTGEDCDIYVMNADGTNLVNITNKPKGYTEFGMDAGHSLDWQPLRGVTPPKVGDNSSNIAQATTKSGEDDVDSDRQQQPGPREATPEKQQEERQQNQQQQPSQHGSKSRSLTVHPPDTGGTSLTLVASALFFSGGSLLYAVVRRRM